MITKGDPERITTPRILQEAGIQYEIVCHTDEDASLLRDQFHVPCHASHPPEGYKAMGHNRDWILKNLLKKGDWYIGVDDNISEIYYPKSATGDSVDDDPFWREDFMTPLEPSRLYPMMVELRDKCIEQKTVYGGCGYIDNFFFRRNHWSYHCYVKSKLFVAMHDGVPWNWDSRLGIMLDHAKTYDIIARYGRVVVNKWLFPKHPRFQPGGLGSLAERMPARLMTMAVFRDVFDGLVTIKEGESGELDNPQLKLRSQQTIDKWRINHGHL